MNEDAKNLIVNAEERTATIKKDYKVNGELHKNAVFVAKYPSVIERITIGTIRAKLLDGAPLQSIDKMTDDFSYMVAFLQVTLTKAPKWFNLEELEELDVLRDLFYTVVGWVNSFRREIEDTEDAGSGSATSDEEIVEGN